MAEHPTRPPFRQNGVVPEQLASARQAGGRAEQLPPVQTLPPPQVLPFGFCLHLPFLQTLQSVHLG